MSRSDVTTRNRRLSRSLAEAYDDLERRIAELAAESANIPAPIATTAQDD